MPAVSKAQKRFWCFVKSCKESNYKDCGTGTDIKNTAKDTSMKDIEDYCSTSEKGLPEKLPENMNINGLSQLLKEDKESIPMSCSCMDGEPSCGSSAFDDGCVNDIDCDGVCDENGNYIPRSNIENDGPNMVSTQGSGFKTPQGGSDRLAKFNRRQMGESDLRRLVKRVLREETTLLTEAPFKCPANPLSINLAPGWVMEVQLNPNMWLDVSGNGSLFNIDFSSGSYMCKLTFTFKKAPPEGGGPRGGKGLKGVETKGNVTMMGGGSGFKKPQGVSNTLAKFNRRQTGELREGHLINEQNTHWRCEQAHHTCECIQVMGYPSNPANAYQTQQDCMVDQGNCCGQMNWMCAGNGACHPDPNGPYNTYQDCQASCQQQDEWYCTVNPCLVPPCPAQCQSVPQGSPPPPNTINGPWPDIMHCQNLCQTQPPLPTWKCKNKGSHPKFGKKCVQLQPGQGDFITKQECVDSGCQGIGPDISKDREVDGPRVTPDVKQDIEIIDLNEEINRQKEIMGFITEQNWESSLDGWDTQKEAKDEGKYCEDNSIGGIEYFEGQYCVVESNWYDWETTMGTQKEGRSHHGKWQCGVGCVIPKGESGRYGN